MIQLYFAMRTFCDAFYTLSCDPTASKDFFDCPLRPKRYTEFVGRFMMEVQRYDRRFGLIDGEIGFTRE